MTFIPVFIAGTVATFGFADFTVGLTYSIVLGGIWGFLLTLKETP